MRFYSIYIKFIFFLSLTTFSAYAQLTHPCGFRNRADVRLDAPGQVMEKIKARNQYYDICYAHTATDMFDAYRVLRGDKKHEWRSSPLATAVATAKKIRSGDSSAMGFEIGKICMAFDTLIAEGSRNFKEVDRRILRNTLQVTTDQEHDYGPTSAAFKDFFRQLNFHYLLTDGIPRATLSKKQDEVAYRLQCFLKSKSHEEQELQLHLKWEGLLEAMKEKSFLGFLNRLILQYAPKTHKVANDRVECKQMYMNMFNRKKYIFKIHRSLNKGAKALPVGLDFCQRLLTHGEVGIKEATEEDEARCERHAVSIIGRRERAGKCQLLVKNTFPCKSMLKKYDCEQGKVWVDQEDLIDSSFSIHYLKAY